MSKASPSIFHIFTKDGKQRFIRQVGQGITLIDGCSKDYLISVVCNTGEPVVSFGERSYLVCWDDIVKLAKDAGLFDIASEVSNE